MIFESMMVAGSTVQNWVRSQFLPWILVAWISAKAHAVTAAAVAPTVVAAVAPVASAVAPPVAPAPVATAATGATAGAAEPAVSAAKRHTKVRAKGKRHFQRNLSKFQLLPSKVTRVKLHLVDRHGAHL